MFDFTGLADMKGWMTAPAAADPGIVISSRVRLARNLEGFAYPGVLSAQEEKRCQEKILAAFRALPEARSYAIARIEELPPLERRILFERSVISQAYSLEKDRAVVLSADGSLAAVLCEEDHLRLAAFGAGACLEELLARVAGLDAALEGALGYAVSAEWGYLNSAITNLGTGLKASMMLHLPALSMGGLIRKAVKASAQLGLSIRGFYGENMESLGDMYLIANEVTIGLSESEVLGSLARIAAQLAAFEARTREELVEKRRVDLEDRVLRAWGLLTHCRYLGLREAIESLSSLRLGVALGLVTGVSAAAITPLLFLAQKSHVQKVLQASQDSADTKLIDYTRAKLVREALLNERGG